MTRHFGGSLRAAALLLPLLLLAGCKTELYTSLGQDEAMQMVAVLDRNGIPADRVFAKDGTSTIEVPNGEIARAVTLLQANGLPRPQYESMGDVFKQQGMIPSPTAERARYVYGLQQELSRTLSDIDGVLTARVQIVLPDNDPLSGDTAPSAASVFIRYDRKVDLAGMIPQIKMTVADGVQGLSYDKVSVVLVPVTLPAATAVAPLPAQSGLPWGWLVAGLWPLLGGAWLGWRHRDRLLRRGAPVPTVAVTRLRRVS